MRLSFLSGHQKNRQIERSFLISMRRRYAFCPISKVANSSIKAFLLEAEAKSFGLPMKGLASSKRNVHDLTYGTLLRPFQFPKQQLQNILTSGKYTRFVFVRDPVARLVSCYLDRVKTVDSVPHREVTKGLGKAIGAEISFKEFVEFVAGQDIIEMNPHWRPQYYEGFLDKIEYDHVLRLENFQHDMGEILTKLYPKIANDINVARNFSPSKTDASEKKQDFVDSGMKALIEEIYKVDMEHLGY